MSPQLIAALIIAVASSGATLTVTRWYYKSEEAKHAKQTYEANLESQRLAFRTQTQNDQRVIAAQSAAAPKLNALRESVVSLRDAYVGLSNDSSSLLSRARESHDACIVAATAQKSISDQCTDRYTNLAAAAQGHVIDIETLTASWPKCEPPILQK